MRRFEQIYYSISQFNEQILEHLIKFVSEIIKSKADKKEVEGEEIIVLKDSSI